MSALVIPLPPDVDSAQALDAWKFIYSSVFPEEVLDIAVRARIKHSRKEIISEKIGELMMFSGAWRAQK